MTRIVLLGAGASFGSVDATPTVPPLGTGLFDALAARGGIAFEIPEKLKVTFRADFELGMADFYEYSDGNVMRFQRELAEFMAEFEPGPESAYVHLIKNLNITRCMLCTLNYDLLIELAAGRLGYNTAYTSEHSPGCLRLLKLHGSCNFWPHMPGISFRKSTFARNAHADVQTSIKPLSRDDTLHKCATDDSFAPAIAMYAEGKPVKVSPDYVEEQQAMWASAVGSASRICIVGTQVNPADGHIWMPLSNTSADIFYFGLTEDQELFAEWKKECRKTNMYFLISEFSEAVLTIAKKLM